MNIFNMKKSDFKTIPHIPCYNDKDIKFNCLVIIPTNYKHDSGYRCMEYCAVKDGEPIGIFGGGSDIIHLDGIGGYGKCGIGGYGKWTMEIPNKFDRKPWNIDCLPCGYLRLWCDGYVLVAKDCLSDFKLYTEKKNK